MVRPAGVTFSTLGTMVSADADGAVAEVTVAAVAVDVAVDAAVDEAVAEGTVAAVAEGIRPGS